MPIAKIILKDEVNCKIEGLEPNVRRKLMQTFKFEKPGARYMPAVRLGRWDGCVNFFHLGGSTYINLLPEIIPIIEEYGYQFLLDDQRTPWPEMTFDPVTEDVNANTLWPEGHRLAGQPIMLDIHQVEVCNAFLNNHHGITKASTGAGKTIITATLSKRVEKYGRSLVIVPNKSLVSQTEEDFKLLGLDVGVYFGDRKDVGKTHTICTWQSLSTILRAKKKGAETVATIDDFTRDLVCVIVDECFAKDTPVLTPTGYVPIQTLKPGDIIINFSEKTKTFKEDVVIRLHQNLPKANNEKMYRLEFDNGVVIQVTGNHKFLTTNGWVRADSITDEHTIISNSA